MKLFSKIASAIVGIAMAIGVGVAVSSVDSKSVKADSTANFTLSSASNVTVDGVTASFAKGSGSNAPTWYEAGLRLYASNTVTISSSNTITGVSFNWEKQGKKDFASVTANKGTYSHPSAAGTGTWSGSETEIVFTLGSSGQLQLNTFSVSYSGGGAVLSGITLDVSGAKTSYYDGDAASIAGLTVTANYEGGTSSDVTSSATITPTPATVTMSTSSISYTATYETKSDTKSVGITVSEKPAGSDYVLYSGAISEGDYVVTYNSYALKASITSNRFGYETVTPSSDTITSPDDSLIWHIAQDGEYWTLYNDSTSKYAGSTGSKNQGALLSSVTDNAKWTVTGTETYDFENLARSESSSDSGNKWLRNNGTYGFACYASGTGGALSLYKLKEAELPELYITDTDINILTTVSVNVGEEKILVARDVSKNNVKNVTWTVDDSSVLTHTYTPGDNSYTVNITGAKKGETSITLSKEGYKSATIPVTVNDPSLKLMKIWDSYGEAPTQQYKFSNTEGFHSFYACNEGASELEPLSGVTWSSSYTSIATIDASTGKLTTHYLGKTTLTATKDGYDSASVEITITEGPLERIEVTGSMSKLEYTTSESWDPTGLIVTAYYGSDWTKILTFVSWEYDPATPSVGVTSVVATATYEGKTASSTAQSVTVSEPVVEQYKLVKSIDDFGTGTYLIGNVAGDAFMSSTQNNNNRGKQDGTASDEIVTFVDGMEKITVGGTTGAWTFFANNSETKGYLYAASSTSNHLRTQTENDANGIWTVAIGSDGLATITATGGNSRNTMRYNSGNTPPIFSCYASGTTTGSAPAFWKLVESTDVVVTELSVTPSTWEGFTSDILSVSDFEVSCTTTASGVAYDFMGIGSGTGDDFDVRDASFSSGHPQASDTTLQWKAKYPTAAGGSTYLYAEVALSVTEDKIIDLDLDGTLTKTAYTTSESWSPAGLTVTAKYASGKTEDVTASSTFTYSPETPKLAEEGANSLRVFASYADWGTSEFYDVTVTKVNPLQGIYSMSAGESVDVYGYFVGNKDGRNIIIMDGEYGMDVFKEGCGTNDYVEGETIIHAVGTVDIFNGLYEVNATTIETVESATLETPVTYAAVGGETEEYSSRKTTVTGVPSVTKGDITKDAGTADITLSFAIADKTVQVFYKASTQTESAENYAAMREAVANETSITVKGFTGWYKGFQVQMTGVIPVDPDYTANQFASQLMSLTNAVCEGWEEGVNNHDALIPVWNTLQDAEHFYALSYEEQKKLHDADADEEGSAVEEAMARYDFLVTKYGLSDFIGREPKAEVNIPQIVGNDTNTTSSIVVVSVIALTSISAIAVLLVIKRRKTY